MLRHKIDDRKDNDPFFQEIKLPENERSLTKREHVSSWLKTTRRTWRRSGAGGEEIPKGMLWLQRAIGQLPPYRFLYIWSCRNHHAATYKWYVIRWYVEKLWFTIIVTRKRFQRWSAERSRSKQTWREKKWPFCPDNEICSNKFIFEIHLLKLSECRYLVDFMYKI